MVKYLTLITFISLLISCSGSKITASFVKDTILGGSDNNELLGLNVTIEEHESQYDPTSTNDVLFNITFNKKIDSTTFDISDITNEGTATNITWVLTPVGNDLNYSLRATGAMTEGTIKPVINAGLVAESEGSETNSRSLSLDNSVTYDITPVDVVIDKLSLDPVSSLPIEFSISFSEQVNLSSFNLSDVILTGSSTVTLSEIQNSGDNKNFTYRILAASTGDVDISINAMMLTDLAGNPNNASTHIDNNILYSGGNLLVNINQAISETVGSCSFSAQSDPATSLPVEFKVRFFEDVDASTFTSSDITQNGTATVDTWVIDDCGDNQTFKVSATSVSANGTIIPSLAAGVVARLSDSALNVASTSTDNSVTFHLNGYFWSGEGLDDDWSNADNWLGASVPGATDDVVFDGDVCTDCNAVINTNINVSRVLLESSYTGTLTQSLGRTITVTNEWTQSGGSFVGGDSDIAFKHFYLNGGSFSSTSANLNIETNIDMYGGSFIHNNGTLQSVTASLQGEGQYRFLSGSLNNFVIKRNYSAPARFLSDTTVLGDLTIDHSHNNTGVTGGRVIEVHGDVNFGMQSNRPYAFSEGLLRIKLVGGADQNITRLSDFGYAITNFEIDKPSGTVTFPNASLNFRGDFLITNGVVDTNQLAINLQPGDGGISVATWDFNPNGNTFREIIFEGSFTDTINLMSDVTVLDRLHIGATSANQIYSGNKKIFLNGDFYSFYSGTGLFDFRNEIVFQGTGDQIVSGVFNASRTRYQRKFIIDKPSGQVIQSDNVIISDFDLNNGIWNQNGNDLTVSGTLNVGDGVGASNSAEVLSNCGSISAGAQNVDPVDGAIVVSSNNPNITISDVSVVEGSTLEFTVSLSEAVCGSDTNINYRTNDDSAMTSDSDYVDNDGTLIIPSGTKSATISVLTNSDSKYELDEKLTVVLDSTDQGVITDNTAIGTILNDDSSSYIWTGLGADNNWSNPGNWLGGSIPGASDPAIFDDSCTNCNALIDIPFVIDRFIMTDTYTGTITQGSGSTLHVDNENWFVAGGNFVGGGDDITLTSGLYSSGGSVNLNGSKVIITSTSIMKSNGITFDDLELRIGSNRSLSLIDTLDVDGDLFFNGAAANKSLNGENLYLSGNLTVTSWTGGSASIVLDGAGVQNITGSADAVIGGLIFNSTGIINVAGQFEVGGDIVYNSGTINWGNSNFKIRGCQQVTSNGLVYGNVILRCGGNRAITLIDDMDVDGRLIYEASGAGSSRLNGANIYASGDVDILDWDGGTTNLILNTPTIQTITGVDGKSIGSLTLSASGTINFEDTIQVGGDFTYNSGTLNWNNSLLKIAGGNNTIVSNGLSYENVKFEIGGNRSITLSDDMDVNGDLSMVRTSGSADLNGSTLRLGGDLVVPSWSGGSTVFIFDGVADQSINVTSGDIVDGNIIVDKSSGNLNLLNHLIIGRTGQDLILLDGDIIQNGFDLTVNDVLSMSSGTTINKGCNTLSVSSTSVPTGAYDNGVIIGTSENPNITISDASVTEGGSLAFTVSLSEGVCGASTNISYTTNDGTARIGNLDYTDNDSTLVIPAGSLSGVITVLTTSDTTMEPDETLTVNLVSTDQGVITDAKGLGTIENDDDNGYIWTGDAGDNDWGTGGNWSGGFAPPTDGSADILFNDLCSDVPANCDVNISSNVNVNNFWLDSNYSGTINQIAGTVIDTHIFTQSSGNFYGSSGLMDFSEFNLFGGNFVATSDTLRVGYYLGFHISNSDGFVITNGNFSHNNGTVHLDCRTASALTSKYNCLTVDINTNVNFNNLEVTADDSDGRLGYDSTYINIASGDTIIVENDFTVHDGAIIGAGNIELKGDAIYNCISGSAGRSCASSTSDSERSVLIFNGSSPQTYSFSGEARAGSIIINSSSTVGPADSDSNAYFKTLELQNGTFNAPNASLVLGVPNWTFQSDNTEGLIISGGVFNHNNGTLELSGFVRVATGPPRRAFFVDVLGSLDVYNLVVNAGDLDNRGGSDDSYVEMAVGDNLNVLGTYTINDGVVLGGEGIVANGDVILNCSGDECADSNFTNVKLTLSGGSDQAFSSFNASGISGNIIVDKSLGEVNQLTDLTLASTGADFTLKNGTWNMKGNSLNVNDQLNIGDGVGGASTAVLSQDCQTATSASTTVNPTDGALLGSSSNPAISISDTSTTEGGNLNFTVTLSEGVCASSTNITFTTDDNSALLSDSDYIDNDNTLTILAGDLTGTITVSTTSDDKVESNEALNVNLTSTDQGAILDSLGVGTITNDDSCPTGFVAVDGNTILKTETFCVMQFEARDNASIPESSDSGTPWVSINASSAQSACESMSEAGYTGTFSLISNPEWMTIARDIENNSTNWSGSAVGSGHIPRGHSDNSPASLLGISDSADAYTDTLNSSGDTPGSGWEQARVHTLANNSQIWDFAGNAREWTDWDGGDSGFTVGPTDESASWQEFGDANIGSLSANDYRPFNASYDSTNSFGQWFGGTNGAAIRGGGFFDDGGTSAGVFTLNLSEAQSYTSSGLGFRCVYREQQPPTAHDFTPPILTQDTESIITLEYGDYNGDLGLSCNVSNLSNVTESTPCSCDGSGVCTVGITGSTSYTGPASFEFTITDNDGTSKEATVALTINP